LLSPRGGGAEKEKFKKRRKKKEKHEGPKAHTVAHHIFPGPLEGPGESTPKKKKGGKKEKIKAALPSFIAHARFVMVRVQRKRGKRRGRPNSRI